MSRFWWHYYSGVWFRTLEEWVNQMPIRLTLHILSSLVSFGKYWLLGIHSYIFWKQSIWTVTQERKIDTNVQMVPEHIFFSVRIQVWIVFLLKWRTMTLSLEDGVVQWNGEGVLGTSQTWFSVPTLIRETLGRISCLQHRFVHCKVEQWYVTSKNCC